MEPTDDQGEPVGRQPVRFRWNHDDMDQDRMWLLFTGDPEFRTFFRYKVDVTVKGTLFEPGRAWSGTVGARVRQRPDDDHRPAPDGRGRHDARAARLRGRRASKAPDAGAEPADAAARGTCRRSRRRSRPRSRATATRANGWIDGRHGPDEAAAPAGWAAAATSDEDGRPLELLLTAGAVRR